MATMVQMGIEGFPEVRIGDREDARTFVTILMKNQIPVNLREVEDEPEEPTDWEWSTRNIERVAKQTAFRQMLDWDSLSVPQKAELRLSAMRKITESALRRSMGDNS